MLSTSFDATIWKETPFYMISYDKTKQLLIIHFHENDCVTFEPVSENLVFQLIISTDKQRFIEEQLEPLQQKRELV
ncbi:KTSC domain-containing protein [Gracilibacillus phocaeensis]|uniref:KTSC domain-containing protein n=1 Tax=Gracilibacillus phocaeensis TaxID=2042304 RepID=UPI001031C4B0|nr:KTSC domain-containing protein [Gracilibacillus phocaeensis]